jgi:MEDS: MEthanogen/methylotroph, DcmR Sensory domain
MKEEEIENLTDSSAKVIPLAVNEVITQIMQSVSGEHNILVYSDTESFGKIYSDCCKKRLADNDIVILLTFYETPEKVKLRLGNAGIDTEQSLKEGSMIIADAAKEIFGENKNLLQFLLNIERHIKRVGEGCISVIVSMGAFFLYEKEEEVQEYEGLLDLCKIRNWKVLCCYHRGDFNRLSEAQMQGLLDRHNKKIFSA